MPRDTALGRRVRKGPLVFVAMSPALQALSVPAAVLCLVLREGPQYRIEPGWWLGVASSPFAALFFVWLRARVSAHGRPRSVGLLLQTVVLLAACVGVGLVMIQVLVVDGAEAVGAQVELEDAMGGSAAGSVLTVLVFFGPVLSSRLRDQLRGAASTMPGPPLGAASSDEREDRRRRLEAPGMSVDRRDTVASAARRAADRLTSSLERRLQEVDGPDWLAAVNSRRIKAGSRPGRGLRDHRFCLSVLGYDAATEGWAPEQWRRWARRLNALANKAAHDEPLTAADADDAERIADLFADWSHKSPAAPLARAREQFDAERR